MPRKRKTDFLDDLYDIFTIFPSWIGPPIAGVTYLALARWIPDAVPEDSALSILAVILPLLAPALTMCIVLAWIFAHIFKAIRRVQLNLQTGIESIRALNWHQFEHIVGEIYRCQGYQVIEMGGNGPDGGIDLKLRKGLNTTLVQCKHWKSWKVGVKPVRELYGVMAAQNAAAGKIVITGTFTAEARRFAQGKNLELVDGEALWALEAERRAAKAKATEPKPDTVSTEPVNDPAPSNPEIITQLTTNEPPATANPTCPRCASTMVQRTAKRGPNSGNQFWGCSQYPRCRGGLTAAQ